MRPSTRCWIKWLYYKTDIASEDISLAWNCCCVEVEKAGTSCITGFSASRYRMVLGLIGDNSLRFLQSA